MKIKQENEEDTHKNKHLVQSFVTYTSNNVKPNLKMLRARRGRFNSPLLQCHHPPRSRKSNSNRHSRDADVFRGSSPRLGAIKLKLGRDRYEYGAESNVNCKKRGHVCTEEAGAKFNCDFGADPTDDLYDCRECCLNLEFHHHYCQNCDGRDDACQCSCENAVDDSRNSSGSCDAGGCGRSITVCRFHMVSENGEFACCDRQERKTECCVKNGQDVKSSRLYLSLYMYLFNMCLYFKHFKHLLLRVCMVLFNIVVACFVPMLRFHTKISKVCQKQILCFMKLLFGEVSLPTYLARPSKIVSRSKLLHLMFLLVLSKQVCAFSNEFEKTEPFLDKINLEQSIAAVFNKVAYGSTTKRSIPDNAYPVTTLSTPLLTTYRYSDGSDEYLRVDVKKPDPRPVDYEPEELGRAEFDSGRDFDSGYGANLEKDHVLPTTAPAADILKNNNNKNYDNPNRYNNDRLKPSYESGRHESVTDNVLKMTTSYNVLRNVRPTKSIYSKDVPSYVPPSRAFFTPPLPPEYLSPFADKPTLRGTNSDSFVNRRPIPPPSLMPNKDRIPYRPDLPPNKVINVEKAPDRLPGGEKNATVESQGEKFEKKKTLNTPSQNVNLDRLGEFYGTSRINESSFEYEKGYIPSITRILSGSNGRHDDISDILLRSVTATPNIQRPEPKVTKTRVLPQETQTKVAAEGKFELKSEDPARTENIAVTKKEVIDQKPQERSESVTIKKETLERINKHEEMTTQSSEFVNLPNVKEKETNVTKANSDEIWLICWNVHVYLVVLCFVVLALYSIYKLIRYENDPHMFSKSYFLTIHLMLTVICVLRIFYLMYDPYNVDKSFNIFLYDFLHNFPLSLLATTFAVLILFLLKRTLTHLKVKTRPVFLVMFGVIHIFLCFCLSISETLGHFERASLIVCKPVFVLLALALGVSYLYLYKIIKNVLAKKSQNLSEMCTQNISYASHITIAVALLFVLLGCVQLYALFFIKVDRFSGEISHHWILWGFELSVRLLEISIISLLATVVSLKMSQREKQTVGFPLFPCATSESSSDNIYPNNCNTNPNAMNYSRNEMIMDNIPTEPIERPNLLKNSFQNDSFDKKSTLERYQSDGERFDRFERPKWGSDRFDSRSNVEQTSLNNFVQPGFERGPQNFERNERMTPNFERATPNFERTTPNFERNNQNFERNAQNSSRSDRNSGRKTYDSAKYYTKPKYDVEYNNEDYQHDMFQNDPNNVYSEPLDNQNQYERTRHEFERNDFDRRSRNSSNTSGRRSTTGRSRKNHARPHLGVQTLPNHDLRHQVPDSMLVDDQGFVRFRHMQESEQAEKPKRAKKHNNDMSHYSDA